MTMSLTLLYSFSGVDIDERYSPRLSGVYSISARIRVCAGIYYYPGKVDTCYDIKGEGANRINDCRVQHSMSRGVRGGETKKTLKFSSPKITKKV